MNLFDIFRTAFINKKKHKSANIVLVNLFIKKLTLWYSIVLRANIVRSRFIFSATVNIEAPNVQCYSRETKVKTFYYVSLRL